LGEGHGHAGRHVAGTHAPRGHLDRHARRHGHGLHHERPTMRTDSLPFHGTVPDCDGDTRRWLRNRDAAAGTTWLAHSGRSHAWRFCCSVVGQRTGLGDVLAFQGCWCFSQLLGFARNRTPVHCHWGLFSNDRFWATHRWLRMAGMRAPCRPSASPMTAIQLLGRFRTVCFLPEDRRSGHSRTSPPTTFESRVASLRQTPTRLSVLCEVTR
jgi:hypothetical protein